MFALDDGGFFQILYEKNELLNRKRHEKQSFRQFVQCFDDIIKQH
jgi:hypothetical protein